MSKRSSQKIITKEARVLKSMRQRAQISVRDAAARAGFSASAVNLIENGRQNILERHLRLLLPIYKQSQESFNQELQNDGLPMSREHLICMELVPTLPDDLAASFSRIFTSICHFTKKGGI